ncbi:Vegetative incompatibility protein HET-E-1 [Ceratobasidium sp. AG-Ba]|nr:Vegetative incompatibility protein HET-E-1 [Ceratobasidium sp. AG-Ba]
MFDRDTELSSKIEIRIYERYAYVMHRRIGFVEYEVRDSGFGPKAFEFNGGSVIVIFSTPEPASELATRALCDAKALDPRLNGVFAVLTEAWEALAAQERCNESIELLIDGLSVVLSSAKAVEDVMKLPQLQATVDRMWKLVEDSSRLIVEYRSKGEPSNILIRHRDTDVQKHVDETLTRLRDIKESFDRGISIQTLRTGEQTTQQADRLLQAVDGHIQQVILEKLNPVGRARYDAARACMPGTREDLLQELLDWAKLSNGPGLYTGPTSKFFGS